jgi:hypothetical protein
MLEKHKKRFEEITPQHKGRLTIQYDSEGKDICFYDNKGFLLYMATKELLPLLWKSKKLEVLDLLDNFELSERILRKINKYLYWSKAPGQIALWIYFVPGKRSFRIMLGRNVLSVKAFFKKSFLARRGKVVNISKDIGALESPHDATFHFQQACHALIDGGGGSVVCEPGTMRVSKAIPLS